MKTRWMKSVIETSKKTAPALPFQRRARRAGRSSGASRALKSA